MGRDEGLREANGGRFKYVYKRGAQGMPGALASLLDRLTWDWTEATHRA